MEMNFKSQLEDILGDRRTGVKFNSSNTSAYKSPEKPVKFCDAVISSLEKPLVIGKEDIDCIGANRAFGFYNDDEEFASEISKETKIPCDFIKKAIFQIPVIDFPLENILLGSSKEQDVTIVFVKPVKITKLIFLYASLFEEKPIVSPYFFMSVCANIAVQTHQAKKICISFGCPESRKEGRVQNDEVIVGIPGSLINN